MPSKLPMVQARRIVMSSIRTRFLLVSDSHGQIEQADDIAVEAKADAVIHAGDFGFYDEDSYERISDRELRLLIVHSKLSQQDKSCILELDRTDRIAKAKENGLAGEFQSYINGQRTLRVPVYAVWGNHEDKYVVERLYDGKLSIPNLNILHHKTSFELGGNVVYGLGGNLLPGSKMLQKPIAGGSGKIWSTLSQYTDLVKTVDNLKNETGLRIFVSHVSPGKEPFVEFVGARTNANFTISGHMGAPHCMVWNAFAVHSVEESTNRIKAALKAIRNTCLETTQNTGWVSDAFSSIDSHTDELVSISRESKGPRWYRNMTHINLPDAHAGYAILDIVDGQGKIETFQTSSLQ